jgi:starch synthase
MMLADAIDPKTSLPRPLRVLMVAAEVTPLARAGGLGDVIHGLSCALGAMGVEVVIVTPLYGVTSLDAVPEPKQWNRPLWTPIGGDVRDVAVYETTVADDVRVCMLDCPPLFKRGGIYRDENGDFADNDMRFALLCSSALRVAEEIWDGPPDVLHAHDWHGALAVVYARLSDIPEWRNAVSIFTIHNLAFQGMYPLERSQVLGLPDNAMHDGALRHADMLNLLKGGIVYADRVTTVSPTYATEIITPQAGQGLERTLQDRAGRLFGIVNGIDTQAWDPARDRALPARYDAHDPTGKIACKLAVQAELGLDPADAPLLGVVSRLIPQKGIDMLLEILPALLDQGARVAFVALGDPELERRIAQAAAARPDRVAFRPRFGDPIARRVYAGADIFIMPSRFEPCGLGQQLSMRYGAIPVVSAVGGLADTVVQVDEAAGTGTGFPFKDVSPSGLNEAILRAMAARERPELWSRVVRNAMLRDASWDQSARRYFAIYRELAGAPPRLSLPPPPPVGINQ